MNNRRRRAHVATYSGQMSYAYYLSLPLPNHRLLDLIVVRWPMARVTMFFFNVFLGSFSVLYRYHGLIADIIFLFSTYFVPLRYT